MKALKDFAPHKDSRDLKEIPIIGVDFENVDELPPVVLIKNFISEETCEQVILETISISNTLKPICKNPLPNRTSENYWTIDVLPFASQTKRIFSDFIFGNINKYDDKPNITALFKKMNQFHTSRIRQDDSLPNGFKYSPQIIHYPTGGGYFDWHTHPRYPQNYGMCVCLSSIIKVTEKNRFPRRGEMSSGQMIFRHEGIFYCGSNQIEQGDLVLFRYDLPHCVTGCDSDLPLTFGESGHFMAINPILPEK